MSPLTDQSRRLADRVGAPEFVGGLDSVALPTVLERVQICADLDLEYGYYRRLLQGRLDILAFERARRHGEEKRNLASALPEILARMGRPDRAVRIRRRHLVELLTAQLPAEVAGIARALFPLEPSVRAPEWIPATGRRDIDRVLGDDVVTRIDEVSGEQLDRTIGELEGVEATVSATRRRILDAADEVERAAIRRLKSPLDRSEIVPAVEWLCDAYVRHVGRRG